MKINIQLFVVLAVLLFAVSGFRFKSRIQSKLNNQLATKLICEETEMYHCELLAYQECGLGRACCAECFNEGPEEPICEDKIDVICPP